MKEAVYVLSNPNTGEMFMTWTLEALRNRLRRFSAEELKQFELEVREKK